MKPPPPRLPAKGKTTARAKAVAAAASMALPPALRVSRPASAARWWTLTTMACWAMAGVFAGGGDAGVGGLGDALGEEGGWEDEEQGEGEREG